MQQPQNADGGEPDQHHRAEKPPDHPGAPGLHGEQRDEDADGDGHFRGGEAGVDEAQALHGREHGDGRGDDGIAIEQRSGEKCRQRDGTKNFGLRGLASDIGKQGEGPALALVIRPHGDENVFHGHDEDERPEDQRKHAHDMKKIDGQLVVANKAVLEGVKRACADIAEDDAQRAERQQAGVWRTGGEDGRRVRVHVIE